MATQIVEPALAHALSRAERAFARKDFRRAVEWYTRVIEHPRVNTLNRLYHSACYLNRGVGFRALGEQHRALDDYRDAARLNPHSCKPHVNTGLVLAQDLGQYDAALEAFDQALLLSPAQVEVLSSRAATKMHVGDLEGAEQDLAVALRLEPDHANALCNLGNLRFQGGDFRAAAECYERSLAIVPGDSETRVNLALALQRMGSHRAAGDVLRVDARAIRLWEEKGGPPVRRRISVFRVFAVMVMLAGALLVLLLLQRGRP